MLNKEESMYLCRDETRISDSSPYQWLWQDNDCQRTDGTSCIKGYEGAAFQVRT